MLEKYWIGVLAGLLSLFVGILAIADGVETEDPPEFALKSSTYEYENPMTLRISEEHREQT